MPENDDNAVLATDFNEFIREGLKHYDDECDHKDGDLKLLDVYDDSIRYMTVLSKQQNMLQLFFTKLLTADKDHRKVRDALMERMLTATRAKDASALSKVLAASEKSFTEYGKLALRASQEIRGWERQSSMFVPAMVLIMLANGIHGVLDQYLPKNKGLRNEISSGIQKLVNGVLPRALKGGYNEERDKVPRSNGTPKHTERSLQLPGPTGP